MDSNNLADTQINRPAQGDPSPDANPSEKKDKKRPRWPLWVVLGLVGLLLIGALSAMAGYRSGIDIRTSAEVSQVAQLAQTQFDLGLKEMSEGNYFRARQRFEYVAQLDPDFPGLTEKLAEALTVVNTTATPTVAVTPTMTPTPDLRGVEQLYTDGQQYIINGNWSAGIESLLRLRKLDPEFHKVDIDGLLFIALRNRGWDKIAKLADLEGGTYDLTLAERFAPLDSEAEGLLTWAELYRIGASFWGLDWVKVVEYFAQIAPQMPGLRDGSGMTATERYRIALGKYGDILASQEQWCDAVEQYDASLTLGSDSVIEAAQVAALEKCEPSSSEENSSDDDEESPAPTEAPATEAPPPSTTEPPPAEPTNTPTEPPAEEPSPTPEP